MDFFVDVKSTIGDVPVFEIAEFVCLFPTKYIFNYRLTYPDGLKHHKNLTNDKAVSIGKTLRSENIHCNCIAPDK